MNSTLNASVPANVPASASSFRRVTALRGIRTFGSRPGLRRHKWTATELSDLSVAYMEQSCNAPLWKIAQTLRDQFCENNKHHKCEDESTATTGCGYSAVPSIQAIILKLTDCVYLETNGAMGYLYVRRRPTQLHAEVWQHLQESRRHRAMIQSMKASCPIVAPTVSSSSPQNVAATPKAIMQRSSSSSSSIGKVRGRVFIEGDGVIGSEFPFPPTKRCKYTDIDDNAGDDDGDAMMTPLPHVEESASPTVFHFGSLADALSEIDATEDYCDDDQYPSDDEMYDCERERAIQSANMTTSALDHRLEILSFRMNELIAEIDAIRRTVSSSGDVAATVAPAEQCVPCAKCHKKIDCQREAWTAYWRNRHSDTDMGDTTYECEKCRTPLSLAEQQQVNEEIAATTPIAADQHQQPLQPSPHEQDEDECDYGSDEEHYANHDDYFSRGCI
jgi:sarcosine oxidase delta subunit